MNRKIILLIFGIVCVAVLFTVFNQKQEYVDENLEQKLNSETIAATSSESAFIENKPIIETVKNDPEIIFSNDKLANVSAQKCKKLDFDDNETEFRFWREQYEKAYKDRRVYDLKTYCLLDDGSKLVSYAYDIEDENMSGGQTIALFDPNNTLIHEINGLYIKTLGDFVAPHIHSVHDGIVEFYFQSGDGGLNVTRWYRLTMVNFVWNDYLEYFTECCNFPEYAESHIDTDLLGYILKLKMNDQNKIIFTVSGSYKNDNMNEKGIFPLTTYIVQDSFNGSPENIPYYIDPIKLKDSVMVYIREASTDKVFLSFNFNLDKLEVLKEEI